MMDIFEFVKQLNERKIPFVLSQEDELEHAIRVEIPYPGERWEIEFFADGTIDTEVFHSDGTIRTGEAPLHELFDKWSE